MAKSLSITARDGSCGPEPSRRGGMDMFDGSAAREMLRRGLPDDVRQRLRVARVWEAGTSHLPFDVVVAVPVRDEEQRLRACLDALFAASTQAGAKAAVVLLVNNSQDASFETIRQWSCANPVPLVALDVELREDAAHAGWARRAALDAAALFAAAGGVLMSSDADTRVEPDWLAENLAALASGHDVVCGEIIADPDEQSLLPPHCRASHWLEAEYAALSRELIARLDGCASASRPQHGCAGGASLAFTLRDYLLLGRLPTPASGEDRAFVAMAESRDRRVLYSSAVRVLTSCRMDGRATGGMADYIAERNCNIESFCDPELEPAWSAVQRALWRRSVRRCWSGAQEAGDLLNRLQVPGERHRELRSFLHFGEAWLWLETVAPALARIRLRPSQIAEELPVMRRLVARAREIDRVRGAGIKQLPGPVANGQLRIDPRPAGAAVKGGR